jgi:hypothetical protein
MTQMKLTKTTFSEGLWSGVLEGVTGSDVPDLSVGNHDRTLSDVTVEKEADRESWIVRIPVPSNAIGDHGELFLISDRSTGAKLGSFAVYTDATLGLSLKTEVDLLRAELDMLKRAFRRHCSEAEI